MADDASELARMQKLAGVRYDAEHIQALEGIEGIRLRPAMYIGGTDSAGLHHLVYELVDNSLDEASAGYATHVDVKINGDGSCTVIDNGRGIPVGRMNDKGGRSALEVVFTEIHAGGKFNREGGYSHGTGGLHGVGITAVNACSEWLEAEIRREGHVWTMEFAKGRKVTDLSKLGKADKTGTKVTFKPDPGIFAETTFSYDTLHSRLQHAAFLNAGVRISLADERSGQSDSFHYENGLVAFVQHLNRTENALHPEVIHLTGEQGDVMVDVALQYNDGYTEVVQCFANGIRNSEGGTHLSGFRTAVTRALNAYGKKENLFKTVQPAGEDFREGLAAVVTVRIPDPKFEAQTKIKLVNPEVDGAVASVVAEGLARYFEENPAIAKLLANKGLRAAEAREAARKARDMARDKTKVTSGGLPEKLRDCRNHDLDQSELYLVEGDSAGGSADTGRDSSNQAILPLRGKILNVEKAQLVKVLANTEVANLFKAIGISPVADEQDVQKRRYGKIIVMTDADVDGSHIRTLLLTFIFRHMRELVKQGCVYIAQPPLYRVLQKGRKKKARYVQTHQAMMSELVDLGLADTKLVFLPRDPDEPLSEKLHEPLSGDRLRQLVQTLSGIEEPLEALERRGIDLRKLARLDGQGGLLPRFRVFIGTEEHWLANKSELDAFVEARQEETGEEMTVADTELAAQKEIEESDGEEPVSPSVLMQVTDLYEARTINNALETLRDEFGITLDDFVPAGFRNAEQVYPYVLEQGDVVRKLTSLRELLVQIRELGARGLTYTRFKGLGEMNPEELFETSMDPEARILKQVTMEDAAAAEEIFRVLMGDHVEPRREFIEKHALDVRDLDV